MGEANKRRVVVTGMGVVSCLGDDVDQFYQQLLEGKSGVTPIEGFACEGYPTQFAGEIKNFDPGEYIDRKQARRVDKFISYAIVAGKKALEYAGIPLDSLDGLDRTRCGIIAGSGIGGMRIFQENIVANNDHGFRRISPFFIPFAITNMAGGLLAIDLGFQGPNYSVSTACATGNHAIASAARHIALGEADLMICGGTEAPVNVLGLGGFTACKALSRRNEDPQGASRPFDKSRDGFVLGEGGAFLVLESLEHAQNRGAKIYAEYLGGGFSCDAHHMTESHPEGAGIRLAIEQAIKNAGVSVEDINYVNAHATSTSVGDIAEIKGLNSILPDPSKVVVNATKSATGHPIAAAGGFEAIVTVKAIETGRVHPTLNLKDPEESIQFQVPTKAQDHKIKVALSNSFGFGGHNASVVFAPFEN